MQNFFPHDLEYCVFLDLTKNSKSDVDERGYRLRFFRHLQHAGTCEVQCEMHQVDNSGKYTASLTTFLRVGRSKKKK